MTDEELIKRFDALDASLKAHVSEACHNLETRLLGEFWKWGRTSEMQTHKLIRDGASFEERLVHLEARMAELERGRLGGGKAS